MGSTIKKDLAQMNFNLNSTKSLDQTSKVLFSKILAIEEKIDSHTGNMQEQLSELIEIRKDQEHLYRYMKTVRTETALLREEIEEMRIIVDEMLKHNKSFIEAVHQPYSLDIIKAAKFS